MKLGILPALLVSALTVGWLVPLAWAAQAYIGYLNLVMLPKSQGLVPLTSAPLDQLALLAFFTACGWLAIVLFVWSYLACRKSGRSAA